MKKFNLKIITPNGVYLETEINQLNLHTTSGQIGILANHIPLASGLEIGKMSYLIDNKRENFALAGGFVYVNGQQATIITNAIEAQDDIDISRAKQAEERAKQRLSVNKNEEVDMQRAEIALKKAINRINVTELK